jgi:small-conductance mechanosensitive channel
MELNMFKNFERPSWQWLAAIVLFLAFSRLIPHAPNFTPLGAMALLAGACVKDLRVSLLIPMIAMLLSDAIIGFHSSMIFVYGAVALIVIGSHFWLTQLSLVSITLASIISAITFFIVTNFGAWLAHDMYPHTISGLTQAYIAGIPFFKNTLISNILFTAIGFYASQQLPNKQFVDS